ncbi:hypothetical protein PACID_15980 [Acidipropionibacterium acidipropionici ATCC 4875]|uniref:Uncharacterized protein n=1 Tax=Acidipropionibacterium acidipropionici (strain ATCC 4875 / DSM 20272 / JCM 6432 / NBRC 12425 / NCIMB 8070 / 4) TaxID=1171373 RepID=K7RSQ0_ACIA4|nr:hypothetical protein PACID_15980 [Acidipropionibacterium acidipropionici ATCC 4875]
MEETTPPRRFAPASSGGGSPLWRVSVAGHPLRIPTVTEPGTVARFLLGRVRVRWVD